MIFGGLEKFTLIDYPGKTACMVYTIGCNFRCPYCHNPELVDETAETTFSEKNVFDFLDARTAMLDGLVVTGGEPTLHDDLPEFLKAVKTRGFLVKLDSNGTRPDMLMDIIDQGLVDYIAMDIKSPLSKYSQTVARPVDVDAIRRSIRLLIDSTIDYEFRTTVIKSMLSPEDIAEIGREINGAKKYFLQKFIASKLLNPQFRKKVTYTDLEFAEIQNALAHNVHYCGIR